MKDEKFDPASNSTIIFLTGPVRKQPIIAQYGSESVLHLTLLEIFNDMHGNQIPTEALFSKSIFYYEVENILFGSNLPLKQCLINNNIKKTPTNQYKIRLIFPTFPEKIIFGFRKNYSPTDSSTKKWEFNQAEESQKPPSFLSRFGTSGDFQLKQYKGNLIDLKKFNNYQSIGEFWKQKRYILLEIIQEEIVEIQNNQQIIQSNQQGGFISENEEDKKVNNVQKEPKAPAVSQKNEENDDLVAITIQFEDSMNQSGVSSLTYIVNVRKTLEQQLDDILKKLRIQNFDWEDDLDPKSQLKITYGQNSNEQFKRGAAMIKRDVKKGTNIKLFFKREHYGG